MKSSLSQIKNTLFQQTRKVEDRISGLKDKIDIMGKK
jgi:hypothetical protein